MATTRYFGDDGHDSTAGGDGNDSLDGGNGNDCSTAATGRDTLFGGNDSDTLLGGNDNDSLDGGNGNGLDAIGGDGQHTSVGREDGILTTLIWRQSADGAATTAITDT